MRERQTHTYTHTETVEMELIRGGLRGRPVLGIDPDTGPLVSKRFTAADLLLTHTHTNNVNTQSPTVII